MSDQHAHQHDARGFNGAFAVGIALNVGFVAVEAFYGWKADSMALLADAGHNLSDVAGLVLAWAGTWAAGLRPDSRHTYGWKRASILAAFSNAILLLVAMGSLAWEAAHRLTETPSVDGPTVMLVAGIGIVINAVTALLFMKGSEHDLNLRGAFLHMTADALVSFGVVIAGGLYVWMGWSWIDPVVGLLIAAVVVVGTARLFRQSLHLLFDGVPDGIDLAEVQTVLQTIPGVVQVYDLHVWATGTSQIALTAHLVMPAGQTDDAALEVAAERLRDQFRIDHYTLQVVRTPRSTSCTPQSAR
jgi:cobalt-zinc-cadmium efflux system protein